MNHKIDCFECYTTGVAQGEHTGAAVEMERIIKLLFEWGISTREENNFRDDVIALDLIALIKGEK